MTTPALTRYRDALEFERLTFADLSALWATQRPEDHVAARLYDIRVRQYRETHERALRGVVDARAGLASALTPTAA